MSEQLRTKLRQRAALLDTNWERPSVSLAADCVGVMRDTADALDAAEASLDALRAQVQPLRAEMAQELFRCGDHPALGVPTDIVQGWSDRLAALLDPPSGGPQR